LGKIPFEKNGGKQLGEGGHVYIEYLGRVAIFLRSVENRWGVTGFQNSRLLKEE
jgi:hypothetical protein